MRAARHVLRGLLRNFSLMRDGKTLLESRIWPAGVWSLPKKLFNLKERYTKYSARFGFGSELFKIPPSEGTFGKIQS